jgi:membrane protein DedA with SNARE-associated domain
MTSTRVDFRNCAGANTFMDISIDQLVTWLQTASSDPVSLAIALALATFLTEDGTLIAGSLLVGSGIAPAELVIAAIAVGLLVGDIGVYLLGWSTRHSRFLRRQLPLNKARQLRHWLAGKETMVLLLSRFAPGTRLITYLSFGFLRFSLIHFSAVMAMAGLLWVGIMVTFVSQIQRILSALGDLAGTVTTALIAIGALYLLRSWIKKRGYMSPNIESD